ILEEKLEIFTNQEIKRVINLLESRTASLADCFMEIVQIAIALKKIPASNKFCTLAIAWDAVEDEHTDLQELAKTMFAIVPSQANCERNFSILKWFTEGHRT
ncbi:18418_t:CDS:2, partial [Gigaspora margarita]